MSSLYRYLFPTLWITWIAYWWIAARSVKATERREPLGSRLLHVVPLIIAAWLLWIPRAPGAWLNRRLIPSAPWEFWVGAFITAVGLLFAVWARIHLGRNWSGTVTIKQDHELVVTGPYAWVRNPIYTGLLVAFIGSALPRADWRGILAVLIAWAALWRKLKLEERWMAERFGEKYLAYRRRVPALIPRWKNSAL